jgi:hypothetical protein
MCEYFILNHSIYFLFRLAWNIIAESQGDQPRKTAAEVVAEVVQFRTFREVAGIHPPSMKRLGLLLHFKFRKYELDLT